MTLEDEFGFIDVVIRLNLNKRYYRLLNHTKLLHVTGILATQFSTLDKMKVPVYL